ncbi:MAG: Gfo/Idh/MocA family oxidoreductase [Pirellulales bacterium]|nr:Gfo/Idh/MocA family oxidoreductase [Pirellulales bacterium]
MDWLGVAADAVKPGLESRRIGTAVSVRIVMNTADRPEELEPLLGRGLETASIWLSAEPQRLATLGGTDAGQITVLGSFPQGQTALVCVGLRGQSGPSMDLDIVGSRGTLSWQGCPGTEIRADHIQKPLSPLARRLVERAREATPVGPAGTNESRSASPAAPRARTTPPYGVLLIAGARTHQENYAPLFAADRRCRLVGVSDEADVSRRRRELNERFAAGLGIPYLAGLEGALARDDVQVVSVCAEPERRARIAIRCAEAGKHLYLDKPMAASAEEAEAIVAAASKAGVATQMFSTVRSPVGPRLRRAMDADDLGEIRAIHFHLTFAKGPAGAARLGSARKESARPQRFEAIDSKRELSNIGVYALVLLDWLVGRPVRRVWAATGNYFFGEHQANDMEDFGLLMLELESGLTATVTAGRTGWRSHPMAGVNRTTLVGSGRVATVDLDRPRWEVSNDENPWLPPRVHPEDPMGFWRSTMEEAGTVTKQAWLPAAEETLNDAAYFLDCIEHGRPSDVSAELAASAVRVLSAAYRSAALGEGVAL